MDVESLLEGMGTPGREHLVSSRTEQEHVSAGGLEQRDDSMGDRRPEQPVALENTGRHRAQWIELVADWDELPSLEAQVVNRHLLPLALVGAGTVLKAERDGNGIRKAALPREARAKGEEGR